MGYLREVQDAPVSAASAEVHPAKARSNALSDAAFLAKRSADDLLEEIQARRRTVAGFAAASGGLSLALGLAGYAGFANPGLLLVIAGVAQLVPIAFAVSQIVVGASGVADTGFERGFCLALAQQAKRLGDSIGATDLRDLPLKPDAVLASQLDGLAKELDRATQRLRAAGVEAGQRSAANRLHERIVPTTLDTLLTAPDGRRYPMRIIDVSQTGVALKGTVSPLRAGQAVQIGGRAAQVVRTAPGQVFLTLLVPILPSEFTRRLTL